MACNFHIYKRLVMQSQNDGRVFEQLVPHKENGRSVMTNDPYSWAEAQTRPGRFIFIPDESILTIEVDIETTTKAHCSPRVGLP